MVEKMMNSCYNNIDGIQNGISNRKIDSKGISSFGFLPLDIVLMPLLFNRNKMKEIFKFIEGYPGRYEISNFGRVKSLARTWISGTGGICKKENTILKNGTNFRGYRYIILCKKGKERTYRIASLVWDHFGNGKRNGLILQIDHKDNNKQNDRIDNLQLLSNRENVSKGYKNKKTSSKFTGVSWYKLYKKWMAQIWVNGKQNNLGYFTNEYQAHLAYQRKLNKINGNLPGFNKTG